MVRRPFVFAVADGAAALAVLPAAASNQMRIALDTKPTHVRNRNSEAFARRVRAQIPKFAP